MLAVVDSPTGVDLQALGIELVARFLEGNARKAVDPQLRQARGIVGRVAEFDSAHQISRANAFATGSWLEFKTGGLSSCCATFFIMRGACGRGLVAFLASASRAQQRDRVCLVALVVAAWFGGKPLPLIAEVRQSVDSVALVPGLVSVPPVRQLIPLLPGPAMPVLPGRQIRHLLGGFPFVQLPLALPQGVACQSLAQ